MSADDGTHGPPLPAGPVLAQTRRHLSAVPDGRTSRQVQAIDAWNSARQRREDLLAAQSLSRQERLSAAREVEVLRCAQAEIATRTAIALSGGARPRTSGPTIVIAHRHAWFADRMATLLGSRGVDVLGCTDNGAEALGAVVAEQPDIVLTGDRLAMMTGDVLLTEVSRFSPSTLRTIQAADQQQADKQQADTHAVFLRHQPPGDVADALVALVTRQMAEHGNG